MRVGQAQQRVGVAAHRAGHVDQQHDPARPGAPVPPGDRRRLAEAAHAGAQGAARRRPRPRRHGSWRTVRRSGGRGRRVANIAARRCFSAAVIAGDVAVAQHLDVAGQRRARRRPARRPRPRRTPSVERDRRRSTGRLGAARALARQPVAGVEERLEDLVVAQPGRRGVEQSVARPAAYVAARPPSPTSAVASRKPAARSWVTPTPAARRARVKASRTSSGAWAGRRPGRASRCGACGRGRASRGRRPRGTSPARRACGPTTRGRARWRRGAAGRAPSRGSRRRRAASRGRGRCAAAARRRPPARRARRRPRAPASGRSRPRARGRGGRSSGRGSAA